MSKQMRPSVNGNRSGGGRVSAMFEQEEKRIEKRKSQAYMPFRFWLPKGENCEVVVLDASLEEGFAIREHNLQGSDGKYGNYERCLADSGVECPVCKKYGSDSYLVLLLSVIAKREWKSTKTGETHAYSKMLLPIKRGQFAKFRKLEAIAMKKHGTLRGVVFNMERGNEDTSFSVGEPSPFEDGSAFDFYSEEELVAEFGHPEQKSREGKILRKKNEDTQVYDYLKLYPEPNESELRERHGVDPEAGSRESNAKELSSDQEEEEDDIPMAHSVSELGSAADDGDDEAIDKLVELAEKHGLDSDDSSTYPNWSDLASAIQELEQPKPQARKVATKVARKRTRPVPTSKDGGDVEDW